MFESRMQAFGIFVYKVCSVTIIVVLNFERFVYFLKKYKSV